MLTPRTPVVLIPGIFGSILVNQHGQVLWPCESRATMYRIPFNMLRLWGKTDDDGVFHSFSSDVVHAVPGLAGCSELIPGVEAFYCFREVIKTLEGFGYRDGVDLFAFTYDFRHSALRLAQELARFLEALRERLTCDEYSVESAGERPVVRIGAAKAANAASEDDVSKEQQKAAKTPPGTAKGQYQAPILITHSIGALLPRMIQHTNPEWLRLFSAQIAIAPTFDGGNGAGLMAVLDGYDLHFWFLRHMTRGLWCNSGMQLGLLQSSCGHGHLQYIVVQREDSESPGERAQEADFAPGDAVLTPADAERFWSQFSLLRGPEFNVIEGIFRHVLAHPGDVTQDVFFWAYRFSKFLKRGVCGPRLVCATENQRYRELGCCSVCQFYFFAISKERPGKETKDERSISSPVDRERVHTTAYAMWAVTSPLLGTSPREFRAPDRARFERMGVDLKQITAATFEKVDFKDYYELSYIQYAETLRDLPSFDALGNLVDLYQSLAPPGSLEGLVFNQNLAQHSAHYFARKRPIDYSGFRFASLVATGVPTPAHSIFKGVRRPEIDLYRKAPEVINGDGDGTALLTTQLSDQVPDENIVSRYVFSGISHVGMLTTQAVYGVLARVVTEMQQAFGRE